MKGNSKQIISDKEILQQIAAGDPMHTMDILYKREFPKLRAYILKNNGNQEDARDIFQEVVMKLFTHVKLGKFNPQHEIAGFMYVVGRNAWRKQAGASKPTMEINESKAALLESDNLYETIFDNEKKNIVSEVLTSLGENCEKILRLIWFDDFSLKDVAKKLGYSNEVTVKTRHYKCKQKLMATIKKSPELKKLLRSIR